MYKYVLVCYKVGLFVIDPNGSDFNESDTIRCGTTRTYTAVIDIFKY